MRNVTWISLGLSLLLSAAACASSTEDTTSNGESLKAPTNLKVEPLDGGAHLTWKDNSNEAQFMIERMPQGGSWSTIATLPFDTTQYHDTGIESEKVYMYRVMPMSKDGQHGPASNEATYMPPSGGGAAGAGH